jgi:hypothetical protein
MEIREFKEEQVQQMTKRRIPLFKVSIEPGGDYSQISKIPQVEASVMKELVIAIKDGVKKRKKIISLFDISYTQYSVELNKEEWIPSLKSALIYYESREDYKLCIECRDLITKLS